MVIMYIYRGATMKFSKILSILLVFIICMLPISAFASAETLPVGYEGNTDSLIEIKNPATSVFSTANKVCVISAVAVPGTKVTLYAYDSIQGQYVKLYSEGKALEAEVGAAGLYAQSVELKGGLNNIFVVATSGNLVETNKLDITMLRSEIAESIINIWQTLIK